MVSVLQEGDHDITGGKSQLWTIKVETIVAAETWHAMKEEKTI
jgi:hypothetical protein